MSLSVAKYEHSFSSLKSELIQLTDGAVVALVDVASLAACCSVLTSWTQNPCIQQHQE